MLSIKLRATHTKQNTDAMPASGEPEPVPAALSLRDWLMMLIAIAAGGVVALVLVPGWLPQLSMTLFGPKPRIFWYLGRSSAFVSYVMLWLSIMLGLMMTSKLARAWPGGPATFDLHQSFSLMGLAFGIFHAFVLMGSRFLHYDIMDVLVPFRSDAYRTTWVGLGQIALYGMVIVGFSFYIKRRITQRVWRIVHYLSFAIFVLVMVHGLNVGSDSESLMAQALYVGTSVGVVLLTAYRIISKLSRRNSDKLVEDVVISPAVNVATLAQAQSNVASQATGPAVTVLFGSQSGSAEGVARRAARAIGQAGCQVTLLDAAQFRPAQLADTQRLIIVTSTCGEGEAPDNIMGFYRFLHSSAAPQLSHLQYCVLALGDSSYATFCKAGKDFDNRLSALGARRLCDIVTCDVDFDKSYQSWLPKALSALQPAANQTAPITGPVPAQDTPGAASPRERTTVSGGQIDVETKETVAYSRSRPFPAPIVRNINLHSDSDTGEKQTRQVVFSLQGSNLSYEPGDVLGIVPTNSLMMVAELIHMTGLYKDSIVPLPGGDSATLVDALLRHYDVTRLTRAHIEYFAEHTSDPFLQSLLDPANGANLKNFLYERQLIDLVTEHPRVFATAREFVSILGKLNPRMYSISSSQKMHPDEVHLTIGVVRYESSGRSRHGVCSGDLSFSPTDTTKAIFVHTNKSFRLPADPSTPIIMVGPGTGIAPFRAFLQERALSSAPGKSWLFFGCQYAKRDFLYRDELMDLQARGVLSRLDVAASRDQAQKIYVQDLMRQNAAELWQWMNNEGAHFYVCGDAARMAKDVDKALHDAAVLAGGMSAEQAAEWVSGLRQQKRYLRDVY